MKAKHIKSQTIKSFGKTITTQTYQYNNELYFVEIKQGITTNELIAEQHRQAQKYIDCNIIKKELTANDIASGINANNQVMADLSEALENLIF